MIGWTPEVPTIRQATGRDGKIRTYIVAGSEFEIEVMLRAAGIFTGVIHEQHNEALTGYYRILRATEYRKLKEKFP
ncbi:hypothetical protein KIH86_23030 [Paenibacillus sp. HN-1]|uniref:hypothetical protein n=1 Tax=Paenibacillus TaxID=44249 RepID=UPI001CA98C41|nr:MULTISPECIES: hypothetical protein [Paenibacillus]MBY9081030.1 hypothetical protein [Paenibacillus sp. CGMCC 1.18879]MBY9087067.1 hypothetical protein [Paenibacillus sinensis]